VDLAGTQEKQAVVEGFHGYATEAEAEAHPNSVNFLTRVFADAWIADYNAALKEKAQPGGANANIWNPATAAKAGESYAVSSIPGLSGILGLVGSRNGWIRIAEVTIGVALIIVAVAKLGEGTPIGDLAKKVPVIV